MRFVIAFISKPIYAFILPSNFLRRRNNQNCAFPSFIYLFCVSESKRVNIFGYFVANLMFTNVSSYVIELQKVKKISYKRKEFRITYSESSRLIRIRHYTCDYNQSAPRERRKKFAATD